MAADVGQKRQWCGDGRTAAYCSQRIQWPYSTPLDREVLGTWVIPNWHLLIPSIALRLVFGIMKSENMLVYHYGAESWHCCKNVFSSLVFQMSFWNEFLSLEILPPLDLHVFNMQTHLYWHSYNDKQTTQKCTCPLGRAGSGSWSKAQDTNETTSMGIWRKRSGPRDGADGCRFMFTADDR